MARALRGSDAVRALPGLVGRRVAVRHRVDPARQRDAVGELTWAGPHELQVQTRAGPVRVRLDAVVALREIPPARPRRPSWAAVARLENLCADGWPAPVDRPLGRWRLRAAGGFTGRANSALAVGDPGLSTGEALAEVRAFAAEHGIAPRLQVPEGSPWHSAVRQHGWVPRDAHPVRVLVGALADLAGPVPGDVRVEGREWWQVAATEPVTEEQRHVLTAPGLARVGFALAGTGGDTLGAVRLAALDDHLFLTRLWVRAGHRRRGVATALITAATAWGIERGTRACVLQVASDNTPALALFLGLGLTPHHDYLYLRPGSDPHRGAADSPDDQLDTTHRRPWPQPAPR